MQPELAEADPNPALAAAQVFTVAVEDARRLEVAFEASALMNR